MLSSTGFVARGALLIIVLAALSGCAILADTVDRSLNPIGETPDISPDDRRHHETFLVADLHADTLMWRRGLADNSGGLGQVDLARLAGGNIGLQVFTMPTRTPNRNDARLCTDAEGFDPAPLLAWANGWPPPSWSSPYHRALAQAEELKRVVDQSKDRKTGLRVRQIRTLLDLENWLKERYAGGQPDKDVIAALLGVEGAHAFASDLGAEFDTLVASYGLRLVGPMHHFTNVYGGSSEGCEKLLLGLTDAGKRLVQTLFARNMIVDLAHASSTALGDAVVLALEARRPVVVSHTGIRSYLESHRFAGASDAENAQAINRATSKKDIAKIAGTGGTVGVIYWEEQIGAATVDNVGGAIREAYCGLTELEGTTPDGGFHRIRDASEHVSLGSDWDGAARNAVDAAHVGAITAKLVQLGLHDHDIANIVGLNACRVIAQNLAGGTYDYDQAIGLCGRYGPPRPAESPIERKKRQQRICSKSAIRS